MADIKLSEYPDIAALDETTKLVALSGAPLANGNIPKAVLDAYVKGLNKNEIDALRNALMLERYGEGPYPVLDTDLIGPSPALGSPWNFTRPGSGYVMGPQGIYVERGVDEPRFQWTPDGKSEGLLIEQAATNPLPFEALSATDLSTSRNQPNSLNRREDAIKLIPSVAPGAPRAQWIIDRADGTTYVFSMFARAAGYNYCAFGVGGVQNVFNLVTGEFVGGPDIGWTEPCVDGWWRICIRYTSSFSTSSTIRVYVRETADSSDLAGDGSSGILIWCPQRDSGSLVATSPIPTTTNTVTRPADTLYADMSLVPGFDPTKGTIVVDFVPLTATGYPVVLSATTSATGDRVRIEWNSTGTTSRAASIVGGVSSISPSGLNTALPTGQRAKIAMRYDGHAYGMALNGDDASTNTRSDGLTPQDLRYLHLGPFAHGLYRLGRYYPQAVSDAELQQLSSLT